MVFKRISKNFWNYALYPAPVDIDGIIAKYGKSADYYESIYNYNQDHYNKFVSGLKEACSTLSLNFKDDDLLGVFSSVLQELNYRKKSGALRESEADAIKNKFSVSGTLDVTTNKLVFDFDDKTNPENARQDTMELCSRLINKGIPAQALQICFSGNKGYSVEVETEAAITRPQFEAAVTSLAAGLKTFDYSVKDEQRLFRIPLTKHNATKLYKIPLTLEELSSNDTLKIKDMASDEYYNNNKLHFYDIINSWEITTIPDQIKMIQEPQDVLEKDIVFDDRLDLSRKPNWLSSTKFALQEGFFKSGERNNAFMILAATYRANGFPKEIAWRMLKGVAELQAKRNDQDEYSEKKLWSEIICVVYSDKWKGGTYSESETELLKTTADRFNLTNDERDAKIVTIDSIHNRFQNFAANIDKNTIKTGIQLIDDNVLITTGMAFGILGAPSSGKTAFATSFARHVSSKGQHVLFHSLDMSDNLMYGRFLQKYCQYDFRKILDILKTGRYDEKLNAAFKSVEADFKNVFFNFRSGTSVEDIENDIKALKQKTGDSLKLAVVDYLEKVRGPYSDSTANTAYVVSRLTDLAREYDICVLLLLQPQKMAGDPRHELLSFRKIKGSSVIEQDLRVVLTVWRPGFNPETMENDKFARIAVVKNNIGPLGVYDFHWSGVTGDLRELTDDERYELHQLIEAQREQNEDDL